MNEPLLKNIFKDLGLTDKETEVYTFLSKEGALKGGELAKKLRMHKSQVYCILKNLQSKGVAECTIESPARFEAISLERIIDSNIRAKRQEAFLLEQTKKDLLTHWDTVTPRKREPPLELLMITEGHGKIYSKIFQMIEETEKEFLMLFSSYNLIEPMRMEFDKRIIAKVQESKIQLRYLTEVSKQDFAVIDSFAKSVSKANLTGSILGKHLKAEFRLPARFLMRDEAEVLFFLTTCKRGSNSLGRDDVCLWTNSTAIISFLKVAFEQLWNNGLSLVKIIRILKNENLHNQKSRVV